MIMNDIYRRQVNIVDKEIIGNLNFTRDEKK